jgi:hypothetical protein
VRVRDHVLLSSGGAVLLVPWLRRAVLVPWAASILIDVDHYLWFCAHERSVNPRQAVRYFHQAQPPQHAGTRLLHHPVTLLALLALGTRWRWALLVALGLGFHVGVDVYHGARMRGARRAALLRDDGTCQWCGAQGPDVVAHVWRQPWLLPSYHVDQLISLCAQCHEAAHRGASRAPAAASDQERAANAGLSRRGDA